MDSKTLHTDPSIPPQQHVVRNTCYEIGYDGIRNRLYFSILGFWKNTDIVPDFLKDWDRALQLVSPGFTLLIDMRTMITHPQQLTDLHEESQRKMRAAGLSRIANVMPLDKIASLQVADSIKKIELPSQHFETCEAAQQWLDKTMA
ncbi:hypothetical protein [Pontibacter amylolyticus]|uniref:STAS/SEC14 domain-containing protein n=1 Tax=Pontibacter amylolyticus TaxID=1424080 RepID=A0ABQ1W1P6_9BACT|nr:hypothetical protein [Pontibacter amylolyticus]GGG10329.1 hypothetical protein GCM10011323_13580 [Pontibacter amylolyticus]